MERDSLIFMERDRTLIARIACEIDHHTARELRCEIDRRLFAAKPEILVLDFEAVGFMDSSGLALIIGRTETARAVGAVVELVGVSDRVKKLLSLSGIEKIKNLAVVER